MTSCATCNTAIIFGGKKEAGLVFCKVACQEDNGFLRFARQIPDEIVAEHAQSIHAGACPVCDQQDDAIDVHYINKVWSLIFFTKWSSEDQISCRSCAVKSLFFATFSSFFVGWWGMPYGLIITPIQLVKNVINICFYTYPETPSQNLEDTVRGRLASHYIESQNH